MGYLSGYDEPVPIDAAEERGERPSYDDIVQANESLAAQVRTLSAKNARQAEMLQQRENEIAKLKEALRSTRHRGPRHGSVHAPF